MKYKKFFSLLITCLLINNSCKKQDSSSNTSSFITSVNHNKINKKSNLIFNENYNQISSFNLFTFNEDKIKYIDYITASNIISFSSSLLIKEEKNSSIYKWSSYIKEENQDIINGSIYFDILNNQIYSDNFVLFFNLFAINNKVTADVVSNSTNTIYTSNKSKIINKSKRQIINLNDYGFKLMEEENQLYIPFSLFKTLIQFSSNINLAFNGVDLFISSNSSIYNEKYKTSFKINDNTYVELIKNENRYISNDDDIDFIIEKEKELNISDVKDIFKDINNLNNFNIFKCIGKLNDNGNITNYNVILLKDDKHEILFNYEVNDNTYNLLSSSLVYLINTYSSIDKIENDLLIENYNSLKMTYEYSYPLKNKEYSSFDSLTSSISVKEGLLSNDLITYQESLYKLFVEGFNDIHSYYVYPSSFIKNNSEFNDNLSKKYKSERYNKLNDSRVKLLNIRDQNNIQPFQIVDDTAYIVLDNFILNNKKLDINENISSDYSQYYYKDTSRYIRSCFKNVKGDSNIKNIVFDLSLNTGGAITSLIDALGFISDDPNLRISNYLDSSIKEYHYNIDTNLDGKIDNNDSYKNKYNFYVLQSDVTFSSGNEFVSVLKEEGNVKLIGSKTAGGSSLLFSYNDIFGSYFTISSPLSFVIKKEEAYLLNDDGINPDIFYNTSSFYNRNELNKFISSLS